MVKVELAYNPYLMVTEVYFDGRKPRINSLVEKYQDKKLQDWIKEIPDIFYNEMNGYGFELEFSGTKMDFQQLEKTFRDAGISEEQVVLFHKNEIGEREQKVQELETLIEWLRSSKNNEIFNFKDFQETQGAILSPDYSFIVLNGDNLVSVQETKYLDVSVENIDSVNDLKDVDLKNIPILVCVNRSVLPQLQTIINDLKQREDVAENQLFFIVSPYLNKEMVKRTIQDLGIRHLQIVESPSDTTIRDFYYAYPVTDHLCEVLKVLNKECGAIRNKVDDRKQESEITNQTIHGQIRKIDEVIESLKTALMSFQTRDNVELPDICIESQNRLRWDIENWRKNKIKFSEESAEKNAYEFERFLNDHFLKFIKLVVWVIKDQRWKYIRRFQSIYDKTNYDNFGEEWPKSEDKMYDLPLIAHELITRKEEVYAESKNDLRELFSKENNQPKEPVLNNIYYYKQWREYALDKYIPLSIKIVNEQYSLLKKSVDTIAKEYILHLSEALDKEKSEKEELVSRLSLDELMLENDIDWITTFVDRVEELERG